jgi:hypothetical protein
MSDFMAMVWRNEREIRMPANIHNPPVEGNFCNKHGNAIKPGMVRQYNWYMDYTDKWARWQTLHESPNMEVDKRTSQI